MRRAKRAVVKVAVLVGLILVAGVALARWPIEGEEWGEWTNYENGVAVGGGRVECDGTVLTWGDGKFHGGMVIHPCY